MLHVLAELGFGVAGVGAMGITAAMLAADADRIMAALRITPVAAPRVARRPVRVRMSAARRLPVGAPQAAAPLRAAA